ncbi:hypothetical protein ACJIZ3_010509 [Penstemon smallii]|uniref:VQ domain-containing protein n=1 Tax=Penstemon smallii TaxID=265156 RepID=A0ABD3UGM3_9LAMI
MEITSSTSPQERENVQSPTTNNGSSLLLLPPTPKTISMSQETNPYTTTFVEADTSTFKQVVQMLTAGDGGGSGGSSIPPIKGSSGQKKQGFKLFERRRNSLKNGLLISTLIPGFSQYSGFSPRKPDILSPSILDFPSLVLSPVTPLNEDTLAPPSLEEDKAIAEKKFYFHPSPRTNAEPQLLPLFPLTSPSFSESSACRTTEE